MPISQSFAYRAAVCSLFALIFLSLAWELWLAPLRLFDAQPASWVCAAAVLALGVLFFVLYLMFMRAGKRERA